MAFTFIFAIRNTIFFYSFNLLINHYSMKKILLAVCALLMATLAFAQDEPVVIDNTTPGKLAQTLGAEMYTITNLKVTGNINSDDVATLRTMAGFMPENVPSDWYESAEIISDYGHDTPLGNCAVLDLSEAHLVKGGKAYYTNEYLGDTYTIESDGKANNYMFDRCYKLVSLVLPNELKRLPRQFVSRCPLLVNLQIGNNVSTIDDYSIHDNPYLLSLTIPEGVPTLGRDACESNGIEELTLPNSLTTIDYFTFAFNTNLKTIHFGTGLKEIAYGAFKGCSGLENIDLSTSNIENIQSSAFSQCTSLTSVKFPSSLRQIYGSAFSETTALQTVTFNDGLDGIGSSAFSSSGLTTVTLPNSLTYLGDYAFSGCKDLASISIGTGITEIPYNCFTGCNALTSVDLPEHVTSIGGGAYSYCNGLVSITLPDHIQTVGASAFASCSNLEEVVIPDNVTTLGTGAFQYDGKLEYVQIGKGITTLEKDLFNSCESLSSVELSEGLTAVKAFVFENCSSLKTVTFPSTLTTLSESTSFGWSPESLYFLGTQPATGERTNDEPFYGLYTKTKVYVPESAFDDYKQSTVFEKFFEEDNLLTFSTTGINTVKDSRIVPVMRFDLSGRQLSAPQKGINIVKMSDGSLRKVMK